MTIVREDVLYRDRRWMEQDWPVRAMEDEAISRLNRVLTQHSHFSPYDGCSMFL
jgi:hypothetical protein